MRKVMYKLSDDNERKELTNVIEVRMWNGRFIIDYIDDGQYCTRSVPMSIVIEFTIL